MLTIVKELMEHKGYSVMQNPEYWENDEAGSLELIVKYVNKELPKLFASEIRCGIYNNPNYKYIQEYMDLIGMDVKVEFYLCLTNEEVEEKGLSISNGFIPAALELENYLSTYLKVTYWYKLRPEKRITVYYLLGKSNYNFGLLSITGKGTTRYAHVENSTRFYILLVYLLTHSIEIKAPDDFSELDIVVPTPFWHVHNKGMNRIGLMEVRDLIKEEKDKKESDEEKIHKLARHRDDILSGPLKKIVSVTEKVLYELMPKEASDQIDAKKKADIEEKERLKAYQDKLRREGIENTKRLQRYFSTGI